MARSYQSDFLNSMRFHVTATRDDGGADPLQPSGAYGSIAGNTAQAGFSQVTTPELQSDPVEYREGHYTYTRKYPGVPSISGEVTLSRGLARQDTAFYDWMRQLVEDNQQEYRVTLEIKQYHRSQAPSSGHNQAPPVEVMDIGAAPAKTIQCYQCFPTRYKPGADFDATSGDVSIQELDVALESFHVIEGPLT